MTDNDWEEARETPPHLDYLSPFAEDEVRAALLLLVPPEDAERIAQEFSAIPIEDRPSYRWTEWGVELLAISSPKVLQKVVRFFGGSDKAWRQRGLWVAEFRESGKYSLGCSLDDFVVQ